MNVLAHALAARAAGQSPVDQILGDFVKGDPATRYAGPPLEGIVLHRALDRFTDQHPITLRSRRRVAPAYRRYAGVLTDLYYDHFLARHFAVFEPQPLADFARECYAECQRRAPGLPPDMQRFIRYMLEHDLLVRYAEADVIEDVLRRMAGRLRRRNELAAAASQLRHDYAGFEADTLAFMPAMLAYARDWSRPPAPSTEVPP